MPQLYLRRADGSYTDAANYPDKAPSVEFPLGEPFAAPAGFNWVPGEPPPDAEPYIPKTPAQQVVETRIALSELYVGAPLALRKRFAPIMSQVFDALDMSDIELAHSLVAEADLSPLAGTPLQATAAAIQAQLLSGLDAIVALLAA